ncbi:hypothetical protein QTJ18_02300 (plasmid) [Rhizobium sp. SSA_523]|nr:hypothetical protein QTJ18_02300 [Rhizobium sp. SSA_523]
MADQWRLVRGGEVGRERKAVIMGGSAGTLKSEEKYGRMADHGL